MALKQVVDVGGQGEAPRSRDIAGSGSAYARDTNFDPTNTDFASTQLQALGEEIDGALGTKANKTNLSNYILTGTKPSTALSNGTFFVDKDGALRVATANIATTDDVGSGNSAVKSVGEVLTELNSNYTESNTDIITINEYLSFEVRNNIVFVFVKGFTTTKVNTYEGIGTIPEKYRLQESIAFICKRISFTDYTLHGYLGVNYLGEVSVSSVERAGGIVLPTQVISYPLSIE